MKYRMIAASTSDLIGVARGLIDLAEQQHCAGKSGLHQNRNIGRLPFGMNFAKRRRQIAVDPHHEGNARDARNRAAHSAGIAHSHQHAPRSRPEIRP